MDGWMDGGAAGLTPGQGVGPSQPSGGWKTGPCAAVTSAARGVGVVCPVKGIDWIGQHAPPVGLTRLRWR
eukprot:scaffold115_cov304-Prasinococcus_capsulatus_cf.AAC.38